MTANNDLKNLVAKLNPEQKQELIEYGVRFLESEISRSWNQLVNTRDNSCAPSEDFENYVREYFTAKKKLKEITGIEYGSQHEGDLMKVLKKEGIKIK